MNGTQVKTGQTVTTRSALDSYTGRALKYGDAETEWTVLDRAPQNAQWHLHRWNGDIWISCRSHVRDLELVRDDYRGSNGRIQAEQLALI